MTEHTRMRMFDKDHDGKLDTDEKAAADKWQTDYEQRREQWAQRAAEWRKTYEELRKKHDADGDGQLNEAERKAYYDDYRRIAELRQWDKDKDGKLNAEETAAKEAQQEQWRKAAAESRHRWMLQRWDDDGDGKISEAEQASADKWQEDQRKRAEEYRAKQAEIRKQADADGDGQLSTEERKAYYAAIRRHWDLRRWDSDQDGQLGKDELAAKEAQQARWRKMSEDYRAKQAEFRKQADTDADGQLNAEERKGYYEAIRRYWQVGRWDVNGDGKLDDEERKAMRQGQGGGGYYPAMRLLPGGRGQVWTIPGGRVRARVVTPLGGRRGENDEK
jgi:Ca2+-binding EF-hand superfamily protein